MVNSVFFLSFYLFIFLSFVLYLFISLLTFTYRLAA